MSQYKFAEPIITLDGVGLKWDISIMKRKFSLSGPSGHKRRQDYLLLTKRVEFIWASQKHFLTLQRCLYKFCIYKQEKS